MVKAVAMDDTLVVHVLRLGSDDTPATFDAKVDRFTTDSQGSLPSLPATD